ncbi:MAG TPA: hypothetical protein VL132_06850, partial [Planctomycetaceae bacterium]|nr:hypothetical protein [Planctomycetaceae bacterium]
SRRSIEAAGNIIGPAALAPFSGRAAERHTSCDQSEPLSRFASHEGYVAGEGTDSQVSGGPLPRRWRYVAAW